MSFDPEGAEFLNDHWRMNMVLPPSHHGQFLLGHAESLRHVHYWSGMLEWATKHSDVTARGERSVSQLRAIESAGRLSNSCDRRPLANGRRLW
ncbi:hypothetical protein ANCDUO_04092 [Ancylostoma duodenale]|uniref:Uncharacterized protein n=1 Tax=Ancylostoma duodenale TaxID=51022 RepID=A0A0C2H7Y9_9BILA|nr:hypothetical protein ANCDUO_04092 [Ancylostoma duodenale]